MKRVLILFLLWLLLPIPSRFDGKKGYINYLSGIYWCTDSFSCKHEEGHLIDLQNHWISETDEFQIALLVYLMVEIQENRISLNNPAQQILVNMVQEPREVYADIYAIFGGNIPDCLKEFYPLPETKQYSFELPLDKGKLFAPLVYDSNENQLTTIKIR